RRAGIPAMIMGYLRVLLFLCRLIECIVEGLAQFEMQYLLGRYFDLFPGPRISRNFCVPLLYSEITEASDFYLFTAREGIFHSIEDCVNNSFYLLFSKAFDLFRHLFN